MDLVISRFADLFRVGASARDDDVVLRKIELSKGVNTQGWEEFVKLFERSWEVHNFLRSTHIGEPVTNDCNAWSVCDDMA